jgi:flagellar biosynthesis regulator FlbT
MTTIFIANRPWSPGTQLTDQQMLAISAGIQIGVQYSADVLAQFEAQGGQAAIAGILSATASAGNLVRDDARATVSNSRTQTPEPGPLLLNADGRIEPPPDTNSSSNAISSEPSTFLQNVDTGLDSPVRRIEETQSTSQGTNEQGGPLLLNADVDGRENFDGSPAVSSSVGGRPGAGSPTDDAGSARLTRSEIDAIFNEQKIVSQPNVLDQYASYTYQASVYLCNEASYNNLMKSKKKSVDGLQLLFQTGGASQIGRSQYFSNDYYIDKVEIKSKIIGKGTGMSHNSTDIKINVVEPYGITLVDNIDKAVQSYLGGSEQKKKNFTAAIYLLVIRFYGYDAQGNLVRGGVGLNNATAVTDRNAFVEKFFPFLLANINFKVATKAVEYQLECKPVPNTINASTDRGSIIYNIELSGQTLRDLLAGPAVYAAGQSAVTAGGNGPNEDRIRALAGTYNYATGEFDVGPVPTVAAPPKADAAPTAKSTIRQGLMAAMNEYQAQMVRAGEYEIADEYSVEFVNPAIENARITKTGLVFKNTPFSTSTNPGDQKLGDKQSMDNNSRIIPVTAGTQMVQFLDQVIRNSTFMEDQQVLKYKENSQEEVATGTPAKNLAWFKVTMQAEPKGYDYKRNNYAYRVKYILHAYKINNVNSKYYRIPQFNGVHKQYNYWFTGQNTSVLSYEENLNTLYKAVLTGGVNTISSSATELIKYGVDSRSAESAQGAKGKANEPPANLAEQLYSPTDLGRCNMTIVGDPAWLQQGEAFAAFPRTQWNFNAFLEDGTINIDSQEPIFEIAFNKPADYNLSTGLMDPNQQNQATLNQTAKAGPAQISRIYIATDCTSMFDKGKFTQQLQGTLYILDPKRVAQDNEAINIAAGQIALQNFSLNRGLNTPISSALSALPFLNNLSTVQSIINQGSALAVNLGVGALNNVLGSSPTRVSTPPFAPTSFGLSVDTPTLNTINTGTPTLVIPQSALNQSVDIGPAPPQQLAAGDDAGEPELLNREE